MNMNANKTRLGALFLTLVVALLASCGPSNALPSPFPAPQEAASGSEASDNPTTAASTETPTLTLTATDDPTPTLEETTTLSPTPTATASPTAEQTAEAGTEAEPSLTPTATSTLTPDTEPVEAPTSQLTAIPVSVISGITARSREIFLVGQATGMRSDTFSKVGDSITDYPEFLVPVGHGAAILDQYAYLQPVIEHFSTQFSTVRGWTGNSFTNDSAAAVGGWTSGDILDPYHTDVFCGGGYAPLRCEYWLTRPAIALIMIGSNEPAENVASGVYEQNLNAIVDMSIDLGVIPVLFTIPWNSYRDPRPYNEVIARVARSHSTPLVDYWSVMETLPNHGISADGLHPSASPGGNTADFTPEGLQYGYNVRNLLALQVLDAIWRQVIY
jgi:hypothetical protein